MGITDSGYPYTSNLLHLERHRHHPSPTHIEGFLPLKAWDLFLNCHPDREFAEFLRRGISYGFRIGYSATHQQLRQAPGNHKSVHSNPDEVDKYIAAELAAGKLIESQSPSTNVHISPIGIIPKPHQPGKFRLIVDLSAPMGGSVNDGIVADMCSVKYANVDSAIDLLKQTGKGALMAKLDLKSAYRMVPVHELDRPLLGIQWKGSIYTDTALPFGLRSAPLIFTAVADGLTWAMWCCGVEKVIHYLDDFFFCGPVGSSACHAYLHIAIELCSLLGFPVASNKVEGPVTTITFLGLELDSVNQQVRLPQEKLRRIKTLIHQWLNHRTVSKRQLQRLLGHLHHAAAVVKPGRSFTFHLIEALKRLNRPSHKTRLGLEARADIAWWDLFLDKWNGVAFFKCSTRVVRIVSDASGTWGCAAINKGSGQWLQIQWPRAWRNINIAVKELLPVVLATAVWGSHWNNATIMFSIDNQAAVSALSRRKARDRHLAHLIRCLFFFEAHFRFQYQAEHIPGVNNTAADALSRGKRELFVSVFPQAQSVPTTVPAPLLSLLLDDSVAWTSSHWRTSFSSILSTVSPETQ